MTLSERGGSPGSQHRARHLPLLHPRGGQAPGGGVLQTLRGRAGANHTYFHENIF